MIDTAHRWRVDLHIGIRRLSSFAGQLGKSVVVRITRNYAAGIGREHASSRGHGEASLKLDHQPRLSGGAGRLHIRETGRCKGGLSPEAARKLQGPRRAPALTH